MIENKFLCVLIFASIFVRGYCQTNYNSNINPTIELVSVTPSNVENTYVHTFMAKNNATFSETPSLYNSITCFDGVDPDQPIFIDVDSSRNRVPTIDQVRMIALNHGFNIRDLGGWTGWNGNMVRYEALYRGGSLGGGINYFGVKTSDYIGQYQIDETDLKEIHRLGIKAQLDLRAVYRGGKYCYSNETSYHAYSTGQPVLGDSTDYCNIQTDYGAYVQDASLISDVAWIIYELRIGHPVYFNCRQGADRTGALAFLIEGLLGCYEYTTTAGGNQMAMDYEMTGFSQAGRSDNKNDAAYRPAQEAYSSIGKIFYKMINDVDSIGGGKQTMQERCYYYLNQFALTHPEYYTVNSHFRYVTPGTTDTISAATCQTVGISCTDLDWFINYMLGITDVRGQTLSGKTLFKGPSWAKDNADIKDYDLKGMADKNANSVVYSE